MNTKKNYFALLLFLYLTNFGNAQTLVINELMADNGELTGILDEAGQADDWIEIHNTTNTTIDMSGYFLSDKSDDLQKWQVPDGEVIGPYGYKIFWTDDDESQGARHTNFKLSKSGETLYLSNADSLVLDFIEFGEQSTNISYARIPNGSGDFEFKSPTFRYNNDATSGLNTPLKKSAFDLFPNPARESFTVNWQEPDTEEYLRISVWDAIGQLVYSEKIRKTGAETQTTITLQQYTSGLYYVQMETETYHWVELLIVE